MWHCVLAPLDFVNSCCFLGLGAWSSSRLFGRARRSLRLEIPYHGGHAFCFEGVTLKALSSQFLLMSRLLHVGMRPARVPRVSVAWALVAPGYLADFVLLDRDITACDPSEIQGARVVATYVAGERIPVAEKRVNNQGK